MARKPKEEKKTPKAPEGEDREPSAVPLTDESPMTDESPLTDESPHDDAPQVPVVDEAREHAEHDRRTLAVLEGMFEAVGGDLIEAIEHATRRTGPDATTIEVAKRHLEQRPISVNHMSANAKRRHVQPDEPELDAILRDFCAAVEAVGGKPRGMLSREHVVIYRCALRKLRGE